MTPFTAEELTCEPILSPSLESWRPVLKQWIGVVEAYCQRVRGDVPYYYNERANVGLFAAAVWQAGGVALEEFQCDRKREAASSRGVGDLWFLLGSKSYLVEAKAEWHWERRDMPHFKAHIDWACELAKTEGPPNPVVMGNWTPVRAGVVFASPSIERATSADVVREGIGDFLDNLKNEKLDALAWCFPVTEGDLKLSETQEWWSPGVVLAGRVVEADPKVWHSPNNPARGSN